ncbi:MAG: phenylacetic acid degradation bifunctional protein PaaZ [Actinobacteria bacterium]|nr:phenylacetic acid degradation bifunctional protein PaaZ [Actinomycetota bacterium]
MSDLLRSYLRDDWYTAPGDGRPLLDAATSEEVARWPLAPVDVPPAYDYARAVGGSALRSLTFVQRADILKRLAAHLSERREAHYYPLSSATGATLLDTKFDVDGGIGVLSAYGSIGKRELPPETTYLDGGVEKMAKDGSFAAQHLYTSRRGLALFINAFNFPVWGMLEKFATAFLAGLPVVVRPASQTAYLAARVFADMVGSGLLPPGSASLVCGPADGLLDNLSSQDVVAFTGSGETAAMLRRHPAIADRSVSLIVEADSLNAAILGSDAAPGEPEFDLFIHEVFQEITLKTGQRCTAIRRALVPDGKVDAVIAALRERLAKVVVGDPRAEGTTMGPLASLAARTQFLDHARELSKAATLVIGDLNDPLTRGEKGAFVRPLVWRADDPDAEAVHRVEAFGPAATVVGYTDAADAARLAARGDGSLVASVYSYEPSFIRHMVLSIAAFHGRMIVIDRDDAKSSTGHGSPMPAVIHGGPGRAGGSEEMGGVRGVLRYMQRTAIQGSPRALTAVTSQWVSGAPAVSDTIHPFRKNLDELAIGEQLTSAPYTITSDDIAQFAELTGDHFYAHTDPVAAAANPLFGGIVAHGYLVISRAAGLFVDPAPGPVLANFGVDHLRFLTPVKPGNAITVQLTCKDKKPRENAGYGEVRWDAVVRNQDGRAVATYDVLTLVAKSP